tara:strand:- start:17687 stop:18712 length:1026 start_codon:yes stop_codon:yes gene_type:complete
MELIRKHQLLNELIIIDGMPGCGKTLFNAIISGLDRVELLNYSSEIENICELWYLEKITDNVACVMIQNQADLVLYETMMSRRTNFRVSDLSSAFRNINYMKYIKRLFQKGNSIVPDRVKNELPILQFATHSKFIASEPLFSALGNKIKFIEIVRHPLYMLIQQAFNMSRSRGTTRNFHINFHYNNNELPWLVKGWENLYIKSNDVEKSIYEMANFDRIKANVSKSLSKYKKQILTIPFEHFVLEPYPFIDKLKKMLGTESSKKMKKILNKQRIPRKKVSDGIPLAIYKRCGWEPPEKKLTEKEELNKRRQFAVENGASNEAMDVLDKLCIKYEKEIWKPN